MPGAVILRPARGSEAGELSDLALRSKGHWGYTPEFLEACRAELTVDVRQLPLVTVAEVDGVAVGFFLLEGIAGEGELQMLFVDPPWIGRSVGSILLERALDRARDLGFAEVFLDSDPEAEAFYAKHGAERVGEAPSGSVPGRMLPRLRFTL